MRNPRARAIAEQETTIYSDRRVRITDMRAIMGGARYTMDKVTSFSKGIKPFNRKPSISVIVLGLIVLAVTIFLQMQGIMASVGSVVFWVCIGLGAFLLIIGIRDAVCVKPTYTVRISTASGETDVLLSKDEAYIQRILTALEEASMERRQKNVKE